MRKMLYISVLLVTFCAVVRVHSLECYVCTNCPTVSPEHLKSCDPVTTTSAPTSSPTTPTSSPTTPTPITTNATTSAPTTTDITTTSPTITSTTLAPSNQTTTDPPSAESNQTTTDLPSVESNQTTTDLPSAESNQTTTDSPSAAANQTIADPSNPDPVNPDPENPDPENPDPENSDPENPDPENSDRIRKRRSANDETSVYQGCVCEDGKCDCGGRRFARVNYDALVTRAVKYQCYTHEETLGNGTIMVSRGCQSIPDSSNSTACSILNVTGCKECSTDKCNSALTVQFSILLIFSAFCLSFV